MGDRTFSHPNVGRMISLDLKGRDLSINFHCSTPHKAEELHESLFAQLQEGVLQLSMVALGKVAVEKAMERFDPNVGPPGGWEFGDVVQLDPWIEHEGFGGCLMTITDPNPEGAQGEIEVPGTQSQAYYNAKHAEMRYIGRAHWTNEPPPEGR